jgi:hypothetical protein
MPGRASIDATSTRWVIFTKAQPDAHTCCKFDTYTA